MDTMLPAPRAVRLPAREFTLQPERAGEPDAMLLHFGRPVAEVSAHVLQAQFRLPDSSTLLLLSDDTPHEEMLHLLLLGPDLRVRERQRVGGATTPGFLAYAEAHGGYEVAFCWHDHEQVVTVAPRRGWTGRRRWLHLRDLVPQRDPSARAPLWQR